MKNGKSITVIFVLSFMLLNLSGCVIHKNKGFYELTEQEIQEAIGELEKAKRDVENDLVENPFLREFTIGILDIVQGAFGNG